MAADPMEVRLARLEGSYEQVDRRLGVIDDRLARLEAKMDTLAAELNARIDRFAAALGSRIESLSGRIDRLEGRMYALLFGIIVAILVPIAIRIFFP